MIRVSNINKFYNKGKKNQIHVLNNISLDLPSKGIICLLGHSGSGKTTLLNVISGLDKAKGIIKYDDIEIKNYKPSKIDKYRNNNIGYIFQNYNLLPDKTVFENIKIALEIYGIYDEKEISKRIEYSLSSIGMKNYKNRYARALSGGQQQRVSIARALAKDPKIIIADEPTGNLDSNNTLDVMNILKNISDERLVLLVTHDRNIANFYADRIIEIESGKIFKDYVNEHNDNYDLKDNNTIYLKDLNKEEFKDKNISFTKYNSNNDLNLNVRLIYTNDTYYLEVLNGGIPKLLKEEKGVLVKNESYVPITKEDYKKHNYDTSNFTNKKTGFLKSLFKNFIEAFQRVFNTRKLVKLLYIGIFFFAVLIAGIITIVRTFSYVSRDNYAYYNEKVFAFSGERYSKYSIDKTHEDKMKILNGEDNVLTPIIEFNHYLNAKISLDFFDDNKRVNVYSSYYMPLEYMEGLENYSLNNDEIYIDKMYAKDVLEDGKKYGLLSFNDLKGLKTTILDKEYTIKDIIDSNYKNIYLNIEEYQDLYLKSIVSEYGRIIAFADDFGLDTSKVYYSNVLNKKDKNGELKLAQMELFNNNHTYYLSNLKEELVENDNEDYYYLVGKGFVKNLINDYANQRFYLVKDRTNIEENFEDYFYFDRQYQNSYNDSRSIGSVFIILGFVMGFFVLLFLFLTMRTKVISDHYEISINRVIGATKFKTSLKYFLDINVITLTFSLTGLIFISFIILRIRNILNPVLELINFEVKYGLYEIVLAFVIIYGLNIISGMLPVMLVLRKTPNELIAKYDI